MNTSTTLVEQVRRLIEAENTRNASVAEAILSEEFVAITRARGIEQSRAELLEEIAHPANPNLVRELETDDSWVDTAESLGVVRSVVRTSTPGGPGEVKRFRNLHIFQLQDGDWRCMAWQVTALT